MNKSINSQKEKRYNHLKDRLDLYLSAESKILGGVQSYKIGSRELTYADLGAIRSEIKSLFKELEDLENSLLGKARRASYRVIPRDL